MRRLTKADVERLLAGYDADPIGSLSTALRIVLEMPDATWKQLLDASGLTDDRRTSLLTGNQRALDALATELNELRVLAVSR